MCTAISIRSDSLYFGRTLDIPSDLGDSVVITPRRFPIPLTHLPVISNHFAFIGKAKIEKGFPLYFDGFNEKGLSAAALAFRESAKYHPYKDGALNLASFELLPFILSSFSSVSEASASLSSLSITDDSFSDALPSSPLHFIVSDCDRSIVIESTSSGINIYDNPIGVLTNEPPFPIQLSNLLSHPLVKESFHECCPQRPTIFLSGDIENAVFSGNFSSESRFLRACLEKLSAEPHLTPERAEGTLFTLLSSVSMLRGYRKSEENEIYRTVYSSASLPSIGIYSLLYEGKAFPSHFHLKGELDSDRLIIPPENI